MKLSLGFTPCPNDCFIFDAMIHRKIDTEGLEFIPVIEDVETLNRRAIEVKSQKSKVKNLDITKLSFFTYAKVKKNYFLLDSGSALGSGVGPLVVATSNFKSLTSDFRIAIPGKYTTANLLFSLAFPKATNKIEMFFSEIEDAVLDRKVDAGVIIHESRFTYRQKGLKKIIDLGEWWEKKTKCLIPLGGIAISKNLKGFNELQKKVERIIRRSIEFAFVNPKSSRAFIKKYSQEMNDEVITKHINLYVNKFSVSMGKQGQRAVNIFLREAKKKW